MITSPTRPTRNWPPGQDSTVAVCFCPPPPDELDPEPVATFTAMIATAP